MSSSGSGIGVVCVQLSLLQKGIYWDFTLVTSVCKRNSKTCDYKNWQKTKRYVQDNTMENGHSHQNGSGENGVSNGILRRNSNVMFANNLHGLNGFHRRPLELYLIRINPACRVVWLYLLQVWCLVSDLDRFFYSSKNRRAKHIYKLYV